MLTNVLDDGRRMEIPAVRASDGVCETCLAYGERIEIQVQSFCYDLPEKVCPHCAKYAVTDGELPTEQEFFEGSMVQLNESLVEILC